jgi:hypothetical protein
MKTIEQVQDFCKSIKVNPNRVFFDSNGTAIVTFHSHKHQQRYAKAISKHFEKLGYTGTTDFEGKTDLADWETNAYNEMEASVSTKH